MKNELVPCQKPKGRNTNAARYVTHCKAGHPFDTENTYIQPKTKKRCCRECARLRQLPEYHPDPVAYRAAQTARMAAWRAANPERNKQSYNENRRLKKEWLDTQKTACVKCGENDIDCLDFHHKNPKDKAATVSTAVAHWSIKRLQAEIKKTEMVCANCHRKLHAAERRIQKGIE